MGCCSSQQTAHPAGLDEPFKKDGKDRPTQRPASGTVVKTNGGSPVGRGEHDSSRSTTPRNSFIEPTHQKGKPAPLRLPMDRSMDPNALNITPQNSALIKQQNEKKHEEEQNKVALFIPWEKPALGSKKPKLGKRQSSKSGSKKIKVPKNKKNDGDRVAFIPGTGKEKILMAKGPNMHPAALPPLKFDSVKADKKVVSAIEADRAKVKEEKARIRELTNFMKDECGFDSRVCKLIKQYAEIIPDVQKEKFMMATIDDETNRRGSVIIVG